MKARDQPKTTSAQGRVDKQIRHNAPAANCGAAWGQARLAWIIARCR